MHNKKYGSISIDVDTLSFDFNTAINGSHYIYSTDTLSELSYHKFLPRFLDICDQYNIKATFFIVGKHALNKKNKAMLKKLVEKGHEIANHSMNHFKQLALLSRKEIEAEIVMADDILSDIIGKPIVGFRAPGYVVNKKIISILIDKGYHYDSSLLPSTIYNATKLLYKLFSIKKDLNIQDLRSCFAPITPFHPNSKKIYKKTAHNSFIEIPVNVIPFIRFPFVSTAFSIIKYNMVQSCYYFVKRSGQLLNYNLHDSEFISYSDLKGLSRAMSTEKDFLMANKIMKTSLNHRLAHFKKLFSLFSNDYYLVPLKTLAEHMIINKNL